MLALHSKTHAVTDHFDRQQRLNADPYLETREKEDAFLRQIMQAIESGLHVLPAVLGGAFQMMPKQQTVQDTQTMSPHADEDISAALDFVDSF